MILRVISYKIFCLFQCFKCTGIFQLDFIIINNEKLQFNLGESTTENVKLSEK